jgi:hypothetical protein
MPRRKKGDASHTPATKTGSRLRNEWYPLFLEVLRNSGNVRAACTSVERSRRAVYRARDEDSEFADLWEEALEEAMDVLAAEAWNRARNGSDQLLMFLMKAHRPSVYADPSPVQINNQNVKVEVDGMEPIDAIRSRLDLIRGRLPADIDAEPDG